MADKKISELDQVLQINNDAVFPMSQDNGGTDTTYKSSITQIGAEIAEDMTFSNLQTTSKKLVGAINELSGGTTDYEDLSNKPQVNSVELVGNKSLDDLGIMPASLSKTASGSTVHITDGGDDIPFKSCVCEINPVQSGSGTPSPSNPRSISGISNLEIYVADGDNVVQSTTTFNLGQTVYGGSANIGGSGEVKFGFIDLSTITWNTGTANRSKTTALASLIKVPSSTSELCGAIGEKCFEVPASSSLNTDGQFAVLNTGELVFYRNVDTPTGLFVYPLATPQALTFTGQKVYTIHGTNNIYHNGNGDIDLEYFTNKADSLAELIKAFM